ncbi:Ankyrin repeat domain-containing protein 50 [Pseudolycoriella hygida]|uniref:Ankyrin repeat domain-containing protein 50 n=1 Tax=Pseudolycoriella hygida TaxID=35572 RepID=A0A9Q0MRX2_9DIPT|nr:Ankyrin repeat domain-containing protein 50 [Pseudolycoriella hygida]
MQIISAAAQCKTSSVTLSNCSPKRKMSNKIPSNDIYANLPSHNVIDETLKTEQTNDFMLNNQNCSRKLNPCKEMIYATPLRKSDRFKSRDKTKTPNSCPDIDPNETRQNNLIVKGNGDAGLEDRRILNFLKDTTQLHKKMELHKDFPNSNFSCLAREEHFANLVQQNVVNSEIPVSLDRRDEVNGAESCIENLELDGNKNLECLMEKKLSPDKEVGDLICLDGEVSSSNMAYRKSAVNIHINREWVLKKIAMSLEQRSSKKPISNMTNESMMKSKDLPPSSSVFSRTTIHSQSPSHIGCIILGSNGSGKTSICRSILEGNSGTKGILNRKLLGCYFVNSQNPDCHNLSMFIRSIILQILSHSSHLAKDDIVGVKASACLVQTETQNSDKDLDTTVEMKEGTVEEEELLMSELKLSEKVSEFCAKKSPTKGIIRQKSEPSSKLYTPVRESYQTHPPHSKSVEGNINSTAGKNDTPSKATKPKQKISKIPVKIGTKSPKHECFQQNASDDSVDISDVDVNNSILAGDESAIVKEEIEVELSTDAEYNVKTVDGTLKENVATLVSESEHIPPPLPKSKSCRTTTADEYYEMLTSNPEIFESLYADNIEKNPDDCFKKAILFPLLELTPPKNALLLLIDSIDENYINEGNLISTLKGRNSTKSRNVAELLSNHILLFPKWLFLVCTAKKQNKHITKIFNGFKKITLDDLRKSHVVKDVQEYIINRLNTDFKGSINLSKEVIESLNQLYIKSNGCILYLQKVLNGIKESFFSFREIKLIPCTLNGLYLYICQKSFNKKQYTKIRPILNVLLACSGFADQLFVLNCLRAHNYGIDAEEFDRRIHYMQNILIFNGNKIKIFHNSFCDWLVDVKFATKKFLCDVNEGHVMIAMYYTLISETLCPNLVRRYIYHLIKCGEYMTAKNVDLDLILILLETKANLSDCFYTNLLNCCNVCEDECKSDENFLPKTKEIIEKFLNNELNENFSSFLCDFFKPNLPTDPKTLKLLIETGINNADCQLSYESSMNSPAFTEKSQNIDSELAELLISSERSCQQESLQFQKLPASPDDSKTGTELKCEKLSISRNHLTENHNFELHKGKALIHILANEGNFMLLERALKACKDPIDLEIEDVNGQTALNIASRNGHLEIVQLLLSLKPTSDDAKFNAVDVNHADRDGWTPLRSASWGGHTEVVKLLIEQPMCAIDLADKEERTALRAAAWSGHEDILKILLKAGADVNSVDKQGRTSLIAASYMGHYDIVEILLENGANVNHLDIDGRSALCVAALCGTSGYSRVISCLLEHGANTDQLDNDGMSPLLVSSFEGNNEVCELLLENGADPDLADFMGRTPLWAACTAGHAVVVKLLLFWGCGIDCMDSEGRTVLSIAAAQGNLETVRQLLDRGLDETHRDNAGWTPLHYAAFEGYADICTQLIESGAKIDECDNEGKTALHLAAQEGRHSVIEALLSIHNRNGCVDLRAHDGKTSFRLACIEGQIECVKTLLNFGCDVNLKDADSRTTLYILALENKVKIVKFLLDHSNINANIPDSEGRTALHVAAWQGHIEMVKLLITQGHADVNAMDHDCRTPLHSCAWQVNYKMSSGRALRNRVVPLNDRITGATSTDRNPKPTPVSTKSVSAGEKKPASTVRTSLNTQSHSIAPSGQQSSLTGKIDCIEARIKRIVNELNLDKLKADLESVQYLVLELQHSKLDKEGSDRRISELSSKNAVLKLEIAGLKTNITGSTATTNSQHQQPIESNNIVSFEQEQLNSNIVIRGADASDPASDIEPDSVFEHIRNHLGIPNDESFDPLAVRVLHQTSNHEVMEILLYYGAIADHACKQGATALGISSQEGHEQCVTYLLQYGANPYKSDHCGRTPIKLAAKSNRNNVLRILENFTKNEASFDSKNHLVQIQKSPDKPILSISNQNPNLLMPTNATNSTQSSNNFYENTMHSDTSSLQKRKSVISSQSTGSSNNETPLSFTQQLQRHTRHNSRHQIVQSSPVSNSKYCKGSQKHSQILPDVDEYQTNIGKLVRHTACMARREKNKNDWYIDSVASSTMTPYGDIVNNKAKCSVKHITTADDSTMKVNCVGSVNLNVSNSCIEARDVLHVPQLSVNLLSVAKIVKSGNTVIFDVNGCRIFDRQNEIVVQCKEKDGVYKIITDNYRCSHMLSNDADLSDLGCMSPLYATPPHSPSSDISSPGQHPSLPNFEDVGASNSALANQMKMDHFARDTHMRIILGNSNKEQSSTKTKRSGIATNPAVRMIRISAAQLIRKTNNILSSNSNSQGSSSIGIKSGTFQWRKESQM